MDIKRNSFAIRSVYREFQPSGVVLVSGEDTFEFMQGQFTQDLSDLKTTDARYGFFLTQKGRVLGDAFVIRGVEETLLIASWSMNADAIIARLDTYLIADDVELEDVTGEWNGWQAVSGDLVETTPFVCSDSLKVWSEPRPLGPSSIRILSTSEPVWPREWSEGSDEDFEQIRIFSGVPRVPIDLGEADFPQEADQHEVGVSFNKGCYLGQEVMARLAATGRLRRKMHLVGGSGEVPSAGVIDLVQGDRKIGELRSRCSGEPDGWTGLAMINLAHFQPDVPVTLSDGAAVSVAPAKQDSSGPV